jgi:hypothetical protein
MFECKLVNIKQKGRQSTKRILPSSIFNYILFKKPQTVKKKLRILRKSGVAFSNNNCSFGRNYFSLLLSFDLPLQSIKIELCLEFC